MHCRNRAWCWRRAGGRRRVEAYCRALDAAVLVTGALIDALSAESSDNLTGEFSDQGHHVLRGHPEPIHLFGVIRSAA